MGELKRAQKRGMIGLLQDIVLQGDAVLREKATRTFRLARALQAAPSMAIGFEREWEKVYALADSMCKCHVHLRPKGQEIARILRKEPELLARLKQPMLVS